MKPMLKKLAGLVLLAVSCCATAHATPLTILVSIDGMRPDYLERGVTPNLNRLAAGGARAVAMRPSFPSITFPNHYTLVTGLRPDHHGVVDNNMDDAEIPGVRFSMDNPAAVTDRRWWDQAEPVWVTAELHGIRSGTLFWPGSEAAIHGVRPTVAPPFDSKHPAVVRVDRLLSWLGRANVEPLGFATLYLDDVDHAGHTFGPDSGQTTRAVARIDQAIGQLIDGLAKRHLGANIVIVSDHGMAPVSAERVVRMDRLLPEGSYRKVVSGPYAGMEAMPGREDQLAAALLKPQDHMQCWRKGELPARLAYGHNARVPAFICLADTGWMLTFNDKALGKGGAHGYDNVAPEMGAIFIATGPAFKPGVVLPAFDNVDVYPLLMRLLNLEPLPSDGDITPLLPALAP
ncbi:MULTISPECIES: ectonucleotide pyrophosphatase/phosphodiesterase [unclassified Duganella]|uniref:alkaline phosphatase family protein n=1 Tax=unclassified Duganella TaxID=2636909 RepID=UPI000E34E5B0|nr:MULTISPECIES: ectonucleotide pyrophosphatase/phosphodiesterase [unclassified Duganella]RFP11393.1 alkaline phosphatase family protein [Duganella sp. BJB475]RFP29713.1 alkaline phosphatase family protein [Duganella sp. BJB476]